MADNNTYTSKQNIKKYTTQAKFDAIDKSDVPVGTEYNIVGSIAESDLDSDLQAKVNLTGDNFTTEITGGKVKVKNEITFHQNFAINTAWDGTASGTQYQFPVQNPLYEGSTLGKAIVPVLGSKTVNGITYHGLFLQNSYTENNYHSDAFSLITPKNGSSGNQIYILPYCSSNPGVSYLLNNESLIAGNGITIESSSAGPGKLEISCSGGGSPSIGSKIYADFVVGAHPEILYEPADGTLYAAAQPAADGGSGYTRFVLLAPTGDAENTVIIPNKSGTLATLDDIPTGGGGITGVSIINSDAESIGTVSKLFYSSAYQDPRIVPGNWLEVPVPNTKTLFGNQSILGAGNIDLYTHFITIDARSDGTNGKRLRAFVKKTSSNNLKVDSLADLKTLFGNTFQWDANGYISDRDSNDLPINTTVIYGITESGLQYIPHDGSIPKSFSFASAASLTFTDDVKTI